MKRESGENPEQTRCCKLRLRAEQIPQLPLSPPGDGKAFRHGSKSEDLPNSLTFNSFRGGLELEEQTCVTAVFLYLGHSVYKNTSIVC